MDGVFRAEEEGVEQVPELVDGQGDLPGPGRDPAVRRDLQDVPQPGRPDRGPQQLVRAANLIPCYPRRGTPAYTAAIIMAVAPGQSLRYPPRGHRGVLVVPHKQCSPGGAHTPQKRRPNPINASQITNYGCRPRCTWSRWALEVQ